MKLGFLFGSFSTQSWIKVGSILKIPSFKFRTNGRMIQGNVPAVMNGCYCLDAIRCATEPFLFRLYFRISHLDTSGMDKDAFYEAGVLNLNNSL